MSESGDHASARDKNTKEQYEELGRFVEAFEAMVNEARNICIIILAGLDLSQQTFVSVALHHQALTAKPLFEIMRALIAEICKDKKARKKYKIDDLAASIFVGVLGTISKEYMELTKTRNNLLHGTWYVGYLGSDDLDAKEFFVSKYTTSKTGLAHIPLPKTATELRDLTKRCEKVQAWLSRIDLCFLVTTGAADLKHVFRHNGTDWVVTGPHGDDTLP